MPARKIQAYEGQYYHIVNRGAQRLTIFLNDNAYLLFLALMHRYAEKYHIALIAVCLMPNHYHLLVRIERNGNVNQFIQALCGNFSRRMNKVQRRTGTIFEGRFKMKHVNTERYFRAAARYIHANPAAAGLVTNPVDWNYSDYPECMGKRQLIRSEHQLVTEMFGGASLYDDWIREYLRTNIVGDDDLVRDLAEMKLL